MKLIITGLLTTGITLASLGQGTLSFANSTTTLFQYRDYSTGGVPTPVPPGDGHVELFWAPIGTTDIGLFQIVPGVSPVTSFPAAGRFAAGVRTIPAGTGFSGIAPGAPVSLFVRGWKGAANSWNEAIATTFLLGYSEIFTVDTGDPTTTPAGTPASMTGAGGFTGLIVGIPEPSSLTVFGLGAAAIMLRRRK